MATPTTAPTTLLEAVTQQRSYAAAAKNAAQPAVLQTQQNLKGARQGHEDATKAFAMLEQQVSEIRKQLSTIPTPADGDALIDAFEQKLIQLRAQQLKVLAAEEAVELAQGEVARANAAMQWATGDLAKAEAALKEIEQQSKQREDLKRALTTPPLSTTHKEAKKALETPPHNDLFVKARTRIEQDLFEGSDKKPEGTTAILFTRARERYALEAVRLEQREAIASLAQELLLTERDQHGGLAGAVDKLRSGFQQAEDAFRDYIANAQQRYDMARAMLAKVANLQNNPLTAAQSKRIHDDRLKGKRETALTKEKARDDKLKDVHSTQEALEEAQLQAVAKYSNLATDADVVAAKEALKTAEDDLNTAEKAWSEKERLRDQPWDTLQETKKAYEEAVRKAKEQNRDPETDPLVVAAKTALTALTAVQKAFETVDNAYREMDASILQAWKAAVPDSTWQQLADFAKKAYEETVRKAKEQNRDPETDPLVVAAKTALTAVQEAFETADTDYRKSKKGILHAWEAAVPDSTWQQLADFSEAERLLTGLKNIDTAILVSQMEDAEKAFVAAWMDADQSRQVLRGLEAELAEQTARRAMARKTAQRRLFSALRGDH